MLFQRVLSAVVLIPLVFVLFYLGGYWFLGLTLVAVLLAGWEYYAMLEKGGYSPSPVVGIAWMLLLVLSVWPSFPVSYHAIVVLGLIVTLSWALWRWPNPVEDWGLTSAGAVYLGTLAGTFVAMRELPHGFRWVLVAVITTWVSDSGAYFVGISFGKHKLWPRLSPKKSWEGVVGGLVFGTAAAFLMGVWFFPAVPFVRWVVLGLILSAAAPFGDLSVSMVKRQVGVKDTGHLIPGHGGMLDRLDSLLFIVPIAYYWALWIGPR